MQDDVIFWLMTGRAVSALGREAMLPNTLSPSDLQATPAGNLVALLSLSLWN